jgi:uncharacterized membrane protein YkoI
MRQNATTFAMIMACALAAFGPVPLACADDKNSGRDERESADEVYAGAKSGEIVPLAKILEMARKAHPGEVVETKFEHRGEALVYEIYFLDDAGRRVEVYVNARTGELIKAEGDD